MTLESTDQKNVSKKVEKIDTLHWVALKIPRLIPIALIESVKGRTYTPEQFYTYQESQVDNPYNHLWVMVDPDKKIHGYFWGEQSLLDGTFYVTTFSISKDYWGKGAALRKAVELVYRLVERVKATRVLWATTNEKFFEKHGFKRSRVCLMEYNEAKEENHGIRKGISESRDAVA